MKLVRNGKNSGESIVWKRRKFPHEADLTHYTSPTPNMVAAGPPETSVPIYQTTRHHTLEDRHLDTLTCVGTRYGAQTESPRL